MRLRQTMNIWFNFIIIRFYFDFCIFIVVDWVTVKFIFNIVADFILNLFIFFSNLLSLINKDILLFLIAHT